MLVRAFRVTDRLGNAGLRLSVWAVMFLAEQAAYLKNGLVGIVLTAWSTLVGIVTVSVVTVRSARNTAQQAYEVTQDVVERRQERMAQKAAEAELKPTFTEDPLLRQNRALSAFAVLLLLTLLAVVVVQTTSNKNDDAPPVFGQWPEAQGQAQPTALFPTTEPTPTPIPNPLRVGGALAFTVRENGQDDIWVLGVGESTPLRLTNNPADDRDPAWNPDGTHLAFASNRDGNWELYTLEIATGALVRLTYSQGFEGAPSWSPDGAWLAYEGYYAESPDLDIYVISTDPANAAADGAWRATYTPGPDIEPAWSPDPGREIAFTSWRTGNQDIFIISLDEGGGDAAALNLTNSSDDESYPAWSPDGTRIAYSARVNGVEGVYAKQAHNPGTTPDLVGRGRMPAWAPNGGSLVYALDYANGERTQLITGVPGGFGASADATNLKFRASDPDWTSAPLPAHFVMSGGAPASPEIAEPLFVENARITNEEFGLYGLAPLNNISAPVPRLSDRVNDSFEALRLRTLNKTGYDFLGTLEDAFWLQDRLPEPGEPRQSWHYTGRAIAIKRDQVYAEPAPFEVVREEQEVNTYWRVFVRVVEEAQNGSFGEPLRDLPWDFVARSSGEEQDYERGGRLKNQPPPGYYVDLTQIMLDFGWQRLPARQTWEYTFGAIQFWSFVKHDGLSWEQAMLELYSPDDYANFLTEATPIPPPPPLPTASPTPVIVRSPTPIPPDLQ